ncbi:MAG: hypothetical protein N2255_08500, partial [Kiritimatiellae bacterium]|nr:hypothetical protein [Kiritimatiellia bacterium]
INSIRHARKLKAGCPVMLPVRVNEGDRVAVVVNGETRREFLWPLRGRQEPGGLERARRELNDKPWWPPTTATEWFERARHALKWNMIGESIRACRKALETNPRLHQARLFLANALWHAGEFEAGEQELRRLLDTPLKDEARRMLAARQRLEENFYGPLSIIPAGFDRDLALAEKLASYDNEGTALRIYRRLRRANPRHWRVIYGLACYHRYRANNPERAARLALRALELRTDDRDLVIECVPMLMAAARHKIAIRVLDSAPPSVRNLSICRKMLAECCLETGNLERAVHISSRYRLFNWEGELRHVDVYQDAVIGLIERALLRRDLTKARMFVRRLAVVPKTLGVIFREGGHAKVALWTGALDLVAGNKEKARKIWQEGVTCTLEEIRAMETETHGDLWVGHISAEAIYALVLCARLAENTTLIEAAEHMAGRYHEAMCRRHNQTSRPKMADLLDGYRYELEGDFSSACACIRRYLKGASVNIFNARAHLAAMRRGKRRGEF